MGRIPLQNKIILVALVLGLIFVGVYQQLMSSTPEDVGEKFFKTYATSQMHEYLIKTDADIFKKYSQEFLDYSPLSLVKVPVGSVVLKEIIEGTNSKKVFYEVDGRKIGLILKEEGSWKVDLDLDLYIQLYLAKIDLEEASALGDEAKMLEAYNQLNLLDPQPHYEESIKDLAAKLAYQQELRDYVQNVIVSNISYEGKIVSAFIQNVGRKNLTKVEATIEVRNKKGEVLGKTTQVIFERIPGSRLYSKPIPGGYEKKVSFDLTSSSLDTSSLNVSIVPVAVEYE